MLATTAMARYALLSLYSLWLNVHRKISLQDPPLSSPPEPPPLPANCPAEVLPLYRSHLDEWLSRNTMPLLVIFLAVLLEIGARELMPRIPPPPAPVPNPIAVSTDEILTKKLYALNPLVLAVVAIQFSGLICFLVCAVAWLFSPDARQRMRDFLHRYTVRALPALRAPDLFAAMLVLSSAMAVWTLVALNIDRTFVNHVGPYRAVALFINDLASLTAVAAAIYLSRWRAAGPHGSNGLWPFWRVSHDSKERRVFNDILLGLLCYPAMMWIVALCSVLSSAVMKTMGLKPDEHILMGEFGQYQSPWVLVVIFLTGTLGAAVFEELLFRGILYNVMRRYFGAFVGGFIAAFVFAALHGIWANLLGLFVLALILTWLYDRTGRLVASMTLHFVNNFVALTMALFGLS